MSVRGSLDAGGLGVVSVTDLCQTRFTPYLFECHSLRVQIRGYAKENTITMTMIIPK